MKAHLTEVRIIGTLQGSFWWPIGEPWQKTINERRTYRPRASTVTYRSETSGLRDFVLEITHDGDSSSACLLSDDSFVEITRYRGTRKVSRMFPITLFPSIADCVSEDVIPYDTDE